MPEDPDAAETLGEAASDPEPTPSAEPALDPDPASVTMSASDQEPDADLKPPASTEPASYQGSSSVRTFQWDPRPVEETKATGKAGSKDEKKKKKKESSRRKGSFWRELPVLVVVSLVIAVLLKTFVVQAFYIPSVSMVPTLEVEDRVLVCRFCYDLHPIHRGDVVVFSDPHPAPSDQSVVGAFFHWLGQGIGLAQPANKDFIKRVIGLPGDTVEIRHGIAYVNGKKLPEPYVPRSEFDSQSFGPFHVPTGDLFVMGDNRIDSGDSRFKPPQGLGYVPEDKVIGRAFVIMWPPGHMGWLH